MKLINLILALSLFPFSLIAAPDAAELVKKADRARGGLNSGIIWDVVIDTQQAGESKETKFEVKVKGTNILAVCTAPARQKGETYLFNDRNLWVYRSNLRKPISVSSRQRLSGQTSNGDIAATNYSKDYGAKVIGKEKVLGQDAHKLLLTAKSKDLTYDKIHYWIAEKSGLALQADFLTSDGKPFKRAVFSYNNSIKAKGKKEPFISEMVITETAFPENKSILTYRNLRSENLRDSIFNVNNLSR